MAVQTGRYNADMASGSLEFFSPSEACHMQSRDQTYTVCLVSQAHADEF